MRNSCNILVIGGLIKFLISTFYHGGTKTSFFLFFFVQTISWHNSVSLTEKKKNALWETEKQHPMGKITAVVEDACFGVAWTGSKWRFVDFPKKQRTPYLLLHVFADSSLHNACIHKPPLVSITYCHNYMP